MAVFLGASCVKLFLDVHVPSSPRLIKDWNDISSPSFVILFNHIIIRVVGLLCMGISVTKMIHTKII